MSHPETCCGPDAGEQGSALVGALAAATFLLVSTGALVVISSSEERIAASYRDAAATRYAAEAAAERMLLDLQSVATWDDVLSGGVRSSVSAGPEEWHFATGRRVAVGPETGALGARLAAGVPAGG